MDKKAIADQLRALASGDESRSMAARLRDVIEDVEEALGKGVSRATVLQVLRSNGIGLTLSGFDSSLRRIRKKRSNSPEPTTPGSPLSSKELPPAASVARHLHAPTTSIGSHSPADLNSILDTPPDLGALAKLAKRDHKK